MRVDVLDEALEHEQDLWAPADVRMDRDREHRVFVLAVDVVELVAPELLELPWVHEPVAVGRGLDEHHRRQVVEVPAARDLDQVCLVALLERLHPRVRGLSVVDRRPAVTHPDVVRVKVVVHQAVVVRDPMVEQQRIRHLGELPPGRDVPCRAPAACPLEHLDALHQDGAFLVGGHGERVLVRVAVQADLVGRLDDQLGFSREALGGVTGDEPRALQAVLAEQLQQPRHADLGGEHAARDVAGRILAAVRAEPTCNRVAVDAECTEDLLLHGTPSVLSFGAVLAIYRGDASRDHF